ncbi:hypothetical protein IYY11_02325 [Methylocystis sp. H62]|uniref:hypothetical protein n=1 Tax=Methylocystis sp. H62 TaxID=2785789 RepID=UPI0018C2575A|nr:hypothetical protein [Methylocystis sp. H62]MBG0792304.1 hypothetical protein [Methylocystis sp. H62]
MLVYSIGNSRFLPSHQPKLRMFAMSLGNARGRFGAITGCAANCKDADLARLLARLAGSTAWRLAVGVAQAALLIAAIVLGTAATVKFVDALLDAIHR